ncbi:MAG: FliM/FliN family flagellar motor switch protein [Acidobacteriota bacterium]|nr:FliM/FliN family flagellar motor switch protein [Acidobacteriota bacterium]
MSEPTSPIAVILEQISAAAATVLSQIAGGTLTSENAAGEPVEATTLVQLTFSGALLGQGEIALTAPMTVRFSALLTGEPADAEYSSEHREAAAELIQQICGNAADRLRAAFGPMEMKPVAVSERLGIEGESHIISVAHGDTPLQFELRLMGVAVAETAKSDEPAAETAQAAEGLPLPPPPPPLESTGNRNLDLLLDIELNATLRFGTRQMLLRDILELCSGSVVELDRAVQEPVDLLIDGRIIAQGEVVIVDGNYGLRVLQVASRGDKIACLPR